MKSVRLYKDGEPYTMVFVPSHLSGFLRFSVLIEGEWVELEARMPDPDLGHSPETWIARYLERATTL